MTSLREDSWFAEWMQDVTARKVQAGLLIEAITQGHHDTSTLYDLQYIVNHEILCHKVESATPDLQASMSPSNTDPTVNDFFPIAFSHNWTDQWLVTLSQCLVNSINERSHYE